MAWNADWAGIQNEEIRSFLPYFEDLHYALYERLAIQTNGFGSIAPLPTITTRFNTIDNYLRQFEPLFDELINPVARTMNAGQTFRNTFLTSPVTFPAGAGNTGRYVFPSFDKTQLLSEIGDISFHSRGAKFLSHDGLKDLLLQRKEMFDLLTKMIYPGVFLLNSGNIAGQTVNGHAYFLYTDSGIVVSGNKFVPSAIPRIQLEKYYNAIDRKIYEAEEYENNLTINCHWKNYEGVPFPLKFTAQYAVEQNIQNNSGNPVLADNVTFTGVNQDNPTLMETITHDFTIEGELPPAPLAPYNAVGVIQSSRIGGQGQTGSYDFTVIPEPVKAGPNFPRGVTEGRDQYYYFPVAIIDFGIEGGFSKSLNAI